MSPITHFLAGWTLANAARLKRRERWLVTLAGVIPDTDGLGLPVELLTRHSERPHPWWSDYHHILGHNLLFALIVTAGCHCLAHEQRALTALLAAASFHLHLLCDLVGARGPDGYQ
ncbi:MAG TPA: metal-dependent hydrolase, partial [Verrucomicrobiae bacterium]|nr:metal-dependent hydrolase [Verrucomicrobiae bacterium]